MDLKYFASSSSSDCSTTRLFRMVSSLEDTGSPEAPSRAVETFAWGHMSTIKMRL